MKILDLLNTLNPTTMLDVRQGIGEVAVSSFRAGDLKREIDAAIGQGSFPTPFKKLINGFQCPCGNVMAELPNFCPKCGAGFSPPIKVAIIHSVTPVDAVIGESY